MIIGFDAKRLFHNKTGLGYYSRTLVQGLCTHSDFNAVLFDPKPVKTEIANSFFDQTNIQIIRLPAPAWYHRSIHINRTLKNFPIDCYHGLSNELPSIKLPARIPAIVTIHDVLFKSFHEDFPWLDRQIYHLKTLAAIRNATTIIAISQATKTDLLYHYPEISENNIKVVYQSYDPIFDQPVSRKEVDHVLEQLHLPAEFMLYVGSITRRKNLGIILQAIKIIPEGKRIPLLIAGKGSTYEKKMKAFISAHQLDRWISFLPGLTRAQLRILYDGAQCVLYPSLKEGFGLPVLEAIAANTPVITSGLSSMPEAGGELANYFNPENAEDLAIQMQRVNKLHFQQSNEMKRIKHLEKFSLEAISNQYIDEVYEPAIKLNR